MLRTALLATAISIAPVAAHALDATNTWRGSVIVTNATTQCNTNAAFAKGSTRLAVFRPKMAAAHPNSALVITLPNGALFGSANSATSINGPYTGILLSGIATAAVNYTGGAYNFTISPAAPTASTPQISISGTVTKAGNITGCTLTIKGSFFKGVI
jgi:hypothetical protein